MKNRARTFFPQIISQIILLIIASLLFYFSNPNNLVENGISLLGWLIYFPVLLIIKHSSLKTSLIYGGLYGCLSYGLYGYWLNNFHPLGLIIVCICYFFILAFVFFILKIIQLLFKKNHWIVQWLFICSYEYLKTLGFIGFSYGVSAYTQWTNLYFIQAAQIAGVFGLNLLVIFPSCFVYGFIYKNTKLVKTSGIIYLFSLISVFTFGIIQVKKGAECEYVQVAAIQNNESPWKYGIEEYSRNVRDLMALTDEALDLTSDIDFIIWPETAVVPSVMYQYYKRVDERRFNLINSLLCYIDNKDAVFIIGNSHEVPAKNGEKDRYNSALIFNPGENVLPPDPDIFSKIHLVPFTESFPYKKYFPRLYIKLLNGDNHMWEKGSDYSVFNYKGLCFSTPICFEDTFGNDCRKFVQNGARCFMNLSNDSWSESLSCQNQHLAMAVFRSVENGVPTVRSTSSGQTCIINQKGVIEKMATPFCKTYVTGSIPVLNETIFKKTIYTQTGDIAGLFAVIAFSVILLIQIINVIIHKGK